jgi:hypothetical protein
LDLILYCCPIDTVHVFGFGGDGNGIVEMDAMARVNSVVNHTRFTHMTNMPVVLLDPAVFVTAISPIVCLITIALNAVYAWCLPLQD